MSTILFAAIIGATAFALSCSTDWFVAATDPLKNVRGSSTDKTAYRPQMHSNKLLRNRTAAKRAHGARKLAASRKFQMELRELPFLC